MFQDEPSFGIEQFFFKYNFFIKKKKAGLILDIFEMKRTEKSFCEVKIEKQLRKL